MRKAFLIIVVLMTLNALCHASGVSQQWIKTYNGGGNNTISLILQTMDGGYIGAGHPDGFFGCLLLKLDCNGNVAWQKAYRYSSWGDVYAVEQTTDGGYITAGHISFMGIKGAILKLDSNGDILWQKAYNQVVQFTSIQQTPDGGYIAAGSDLNVGEADVVLIKLNGTGDVTWAKKYRDPLHGQEARHIRLTADGGYIVVGTIADYFIYYSDPPDIWILKLNSGGDVDWQKRYGGPMTDIDSAVLQPSDGGYIVTGTVGKEGVDIYDAYILKLDENGNSIWQKTYGGYGRNELTSIQQTLDGGYTMIGFTDSGPFGLGDIWILKIDNTGCIIWEKAYGGSDFDIGWQYAKTMDGGYVVVGYFDGLAIMKLDSNGEIPGCDFVGASDLTVLDAEYVGYDTNATVETPFISVADLDPIPQDILLEDTSVCYYENPNDIDGDGVETNLGGTMASSIYSSAFLADGDNCSDRPNGPYLGTCTEGNVGSTCIAHEACGANGFCSMAQEDSYPPHGNSIGDVCECEGNFDCDSDTDGTDAATFKIDFGRSTYENPCTADDTCNGDFSCDGDVDGTDAALFKSDFGRSQFSNQCPTCTQGVPWCVYP